MQQTLANGLLGGSGGMFAHIQGTKYWVWFGSQYPGQVECLF